MWEMEYCGKAKHTAVEDLAITIAQGQRPQGIRGAHDPAPVVCSIGLRNEHSSASREVRWRIAHPRDVARTQRTVGNRCSLRCGARCMVGGKPSGASADSFEASIASKSSLFKVHCKSLELSERNVVWSRKHDPEGLRLLLGRCQPSVCTVWHPLHQRLPNCA